MPPFARFARAVCHAAILTLAATENAGGLPDAPRLQPLAGTERSVLVEPDDTLLDVAFRERLGFEAVARLNAEIDEWIPDPGSVVKLPTRFVLPDVEATDLVLNVPEMRLYDFRTTPVPDVYAVAVGDVADPTPNGRFRIGAKRIDPVWTVPASIRAERPDLPARVPPGPDNPLGGHWMTLGSSSYGIHGTNVRWSIGREATHGCVRLYEDEMKRLYDRTPKGTRVTIVYQPFKWGVSEGAIYLEAHPDLYGRIEDPEEEAFAVPRALGLRDALDDARVARVIEEARGVPIRVGTLPEAAAPATSPPPS